MTADEWIAKRETRAELKRRKTPPVVVVCKETRKRLKMRSGKEVWPSVGAAKNAIRNDLGRAREALYQEILTKIEFVPLTETH